jgi:hypothetical protein
MLYNYSIAYMQVIAMGKLPVNKNGEARGCKKRKNNEGGG